MNTKIITLHAGAYNVRKEPDQSPEGLTTISYDLPNTTQKQIYQVDGDYTIQSIKKNIVTLKYQIRFLKPFKFLRK